MSVGDERPVEQYDFCVVGTGAGGGIVAYRLAMDGFSVLSLEQGSSIDDSYFTNHLSPEREEHFGITEDVPWPVAPQHAYFHANAQAHRLYATSQVASTSSGSEAGFINRQIIRLNGKLNLWGGVALRQSRRDFRGRDFGDSDINWPIGYDDLEPHYTEVERLIGVCGNRDGLDRLPDGECYPPKALRPADRLVIQAVKRIRDVEVHAVFNRKAVETRPDRSNKCRDCGDCIYGCNSGSVFKFSSHLLPRLSGRDNYRLLCNRKVVRLIRDRDSTRIRAAECIDTQTQQPFVVEAKAFVLAAGALETPRILLNSRDDAFPDGLANHSGTLGCYLQDSIKVLVGSSLLRLIGNREKYDPGFSDNLLIPRFLFDNRDFRGGFQAQVCHFRPKYPYYLDGLALYPGWLKKRLAKLLFRTYLALVFFGKSEIRRSNRVVSSEERDVYGIPQVDLHYEYTASDRRMQQSMIAWGRRILRKCSGLVSFSHTDDLAGPGIHYAGTCRMADQSTEGVVDANLQSFDHTNLYICDGSVMPDMSEKNLTLTIMALADRLARCLSSQLHR